MVYLREEKAELPAKHRPSSRRRLDELYEKYDLIRAKPRAYVVRVRYTFP